MSVKRSDVRLNTAAHREGRDLFVQHLNSVSRREGMRPHEVISMWLDAAFRSMRGATLKFNPEKHAENETAYARIVKRCREPQETMNDLSHMLAACTIALEAEPIDFIGPVFEEFSASSHMGQFFTPHHLSKLMASLIVDEPEKLLADGRRFITMQEPSCGVGGMVLATCEVLREKGINLATQVHWAMVDVDYSAHAAAYIQTNLCGISADVFHGNTLSLQTWCATPTLAAILHPKRVRYNPEAAVVVAEPTPAPAAPAEPPGPRRKPVQLSLFLEDADAPAA